MTAAASWLPLIPLAVAPAGPGSGVLAQDVPPLAPGDRGAVSVAWVEPPERELPLEVRLVGEPGLELLDNRLSWEDVVDPGAALPRVVARVRADRAGTYGVRAEVRYWICGEELCWLRRARVSWRVRVEAPVTEPPPP